MFFFKKKCGRSHISSVVARVFFFLNLCLFSHVIFWLQFKTSKVRQFLFFLIFGSYLLHWNIISVWLGIFHFCAWLCHFLTLWPWIIHWKLLIPSVKCGHIPSLPYWMVLRLGNLEQYAEWTDTERCCHRYKTKMKIKW